MRDELQERSCIIRPTIEKDVGRPVALNVRDCSLSPLVHGWVIAGALFYCRGVHVQESGWQWWHRRLGLIFSDVSFLDILLDMLGG